MLLQSRTGETAIKTQHRCSFNDKSVRFTQIQRFQGKHPRKPKEAPLTEPPNGLEEIILPYSDFFEELFLAFVVAVFLAAAFFAAGFFEAVVFFLAAV